jgi:uncharacterized protein YkwD
VLSLTAAGSVTPALSAPPAGTSTPEQLRTRLLVGLNDVRYAHGLGALRLEQGLEEAADAHSAEMLADGYFGHGSADGQQFWQRIEHFYPQATNGGWQVGENLLWAPGSVTAGRAIRLWMSSPGHRANILSPAWTQIGIGIDAGSDAPGVFAGLSVTVVTVDFGARA